MIFIDLLLLIILLIIAIAIFFAVAPQVGGKSTGERLQRILSSPEFKNDTFQNVIPTELGMSFSKVPKAMYKMLNGAKDKAPSSSIETVMFNRKQFDELGNDGVAAIAWFGHSSLLIKIHGKVFLTDPVLVGKRASMLQAIGPKRFPYTHYIQLDELPKIDVVLLSHDHYDHLDYLTIRELKNQVPQFIVPLGVGVHLEKWGIDAGKISEYDWWQQFSFDENITMTCTPTRHFSGRALTGRNRTLWCSWIIVGRQQKIYFGADSGYSPSFKEIGDKFGPFDLCLLECGAYSEYWPDIHMMPEQTNQAGIDLKARQLMPIHWGKFSLSIHGWKEPIRRISKQAQLTDVQLVTPQIGEIFEVGRPTVWKQWWE